MNSAGRLGVFAAGLALAFGASYAAAAAVAPPDAAQRWDQSTSPADKSENAVESGQHPSGAHEMTP